MLQIHYNSLTQFKGNVSNCISQDNPLPHTVQRSCLKLYLKITHCLTQFKGHVSNWISQDNPLPHTVQRSCLKLDISRQPIASHSSKVMSQTGYLKIAHCLTQFKGHVSNWISQDNPLPHTVQRSCLKLDISR